MVSTEVSALLKALTMKDLRGQLRARNQNPGGSIESLRDRLQEHMESTGDFALKNDDGSDMPTVVVVAGQSCADLASGKGQNNYARSAGQNVGNFLTDRKSSRVLAPPGGSSQIVFGDDTDKAPAGNNYSRPAGQNVGNFMTDRNSSKVSNPPGGVSSLADMHSAAPVAASTGRVPPGGVCQISFG